MSIEDEVIAAVHRAGFARSSDVEAKLALLRSDVNQDLLALRAEIQRLEAKCDNRPPPPPPPEVKRIDKARLLAEVDPYDPLTYGRDRASGQIIVAGNRINVGSPADNLGPVIASRGLSTAGYNLQFTPDDLGDWAVRSWPMENGSDLRLGVVLHDGVRYLRMAGQWKPDGYDPNNEGRDGLGGLSLTSLNRNPGFSDPMFYDGGPRTQIALMDKHVRLGPNPDRVVIGIRFKIRPFHHRNTYVSGPISIHAPGSAVTGPILMSSRAGICYVWGKHTMRALDFNTTGNLTSSEEKLLARFNLPQPGEDLICILDAECNTAGQSHYAIHVIDPVSYEINTLVDSNEQFGYRFIQNDRNGQFYPKLASLYIPHKWWPPSWNWDSTTSDGNVRELDVGWAFASTDRELLISEVAEHARAMALQR